MVIPTLLNAVESWVLNQQSMKFLALEISNLRRILKIKWFNRHTNESVRAEANVPITIFDKVTDAQHIWEGWGKKGYPGGPCIDAKDTEESVGLFSRS